MTQRQTHPDVPTSDAPPIREWAGKYWYVITASALQARPSLTDDEARLLVSSMEALQITLPCSECRGHYVADWALYPFTAEHARDPELAMQWVAALNARIEARKSAAKMTSASSLMSTTSRVGASSTSSTAATTTTAVHRMRLTPAGAGAGARAVVGAGTGVRTGAGFGFGMGTRAGAGAGAGARAGVGERSSTAMQRSLALRASLMETRANIASGGTRGCTDCGKKKVQPLDAGVIHGRSAIGSGSGAATNYRPLRR
jgi:hypothetical protein